MFGYKTSEIIGMNVTKLVAPEYYEDVMKKIISGYDKPYEAICVKKNGERFSVEVCGKTIHYEGRIARVTAIRDISKRKRLEKQLRALANTDELTGLNNRREFFTLAKQQLKIVP
jgi:PAS domain S-box-containing protein